MRTELTESLERAEALLAAGEAVPARDLLARLAADAEEYVDRNCPTTDELQWFAFPTLFERLAYRRVERDPRELRDVGEPLDRLYADLALADVQAGDYDHAASALKQAVRWNPMGCEHRLNLAELSLGAGDVREWLALSFSVFERASEAAHLARAFANFAAWFEREGKPEATAAALRAARRADADAPGLAATLEEAAGGPCDPDAVGDEAAAALLAAEGLPNGANAEIAVCLLMCATDAAAAGERDLATRLTLRARDLVGEDAAMALVALIRESGADAAPAHTDTQVPAPAATDTPSPRASHVGAATTRDEAGGSHG